jgi:hypothetical protein
MESAIYTILIESTYRGPITKGLIFEILCSYVNMVEKSPHIVILYNAGESEENSPLCICYLNIYIYNR